MNANDLRAYLDTFADVTPEELALEAYAGRRYWVDDMRSPLFVASGFCVVTHAYPPTHPNHDYVIVQADQNDRLFMILKSELKQLSE